MLKNNSKNPSFIKYFILSSLAFFIIVLLIEFLYSLATKETTEQIIQNMTKTRYLTTKIISALIYGVIMALFIQQKAKRLK